MDKKYKKMSAGIGIGALLGFAYYYYIGCASGTCAITSNPYISTVYGAMIGLIFMWPEKEKNKEVEGKDDEKTV